MLARDLPLYKDTYEFVKNLLKTYKHIDRLYRYTLGSKMCDLALSLFIYIERANRNIDKELRVKYLEEYLSKLEVIKTYLRLAHDLEVISDKQFGNLSILTTTMGKQATGWKNS